MRLSVAIVSAIALALVAHGAAARELGTDPQRASTCAAFEGVAFTFCVALCEARECDRQPMDDVRCALLRRGFARVTGTRAPCDGGVTRSSFRIPS